MTHFAGRQYSMMSIVYLARPNIHERNRFIQMGRPICFLFYVIQISSFQLANFTTPKNKEVYRRMPRQRRCGNLCDRRRRTDMTDTQGRSHRTGSDDHHNRFLQKNIRVQHMHSSLNRHDAKTSTNRPRSLDRPHIYECVSYMEFVFCVVHKILLFVPNRRKTVHLQTYVHKKSYMALIKAIVYKRR